MSTEALETKKLASFRHGTPVRARASLAHERRRPMRPVMSCQELQDDQADTGFFGPLAKLPFFPTSTRTKDCIDFQGPPVTAMPT